MTTPAEPTDPAALAAEVERLRAENARLQAATPGKSGARWRRIGAVVCLVLAALLTIPSVVAFWGQRTVTDTQRYIDTVGPLAADPQVQQVLEDTVNNAIRSRVDVQAIVEDVFSGVIEDRPRLQALVPMLSGAINSLITNATHQVITSDAFQTLWIQANTRAQEGLVIALEGNDQNRAIQINGDQVVLDVGVVVDQVKQRLVDAGLTVLDRVPIPDIDRQIVLLTAPQLEQIRTIWSFAHPVALWLLPFVLLLFVAAVALAVRRARMVLTIGIVLVAEAAVMLLLLAVAENAFTNALLGTPFGPASQVFWTTLSQFLHSNVTTMFVLGLVLVVIGWFIGGSSSGVATRSWMSGLLAGGGSRLPEGPLTTVGTWVARHHRAVQAAILLVLVAILLLGGSVTVSKVLWLTVIGIVALAIVQVFVASAPAAAGAPSDDAGVDPPEKEHASVGS